MGLLIIISLIPFIDYLMLCNHDQRQEPVENLYETIAPSHELQQVFVLPSVSSLALL